MVVMTTCILDLRYTRVGVVNTGYFFVETGISEEVHIPENKELYYLTIFTKCKLVFRILLKNNLLSFKERKNQYKLSNSVEMIYNFWID